MILLTSVCQGWDLYVKADNLVDSPGFDANKYYENLISRSSLSELIKTASTLSAGEYKPFWDQTVENLPTYRRRQPEELETCTGVQSPSSGTPKFFFDVIAFTKTISQLFAAGDTIAHLNSRTPQLLGIMTSLQDSFSEISRLVDAIALPEKEPASPKRKSWEIGVEKLRLMVLAEGQLMRLMIIVANSDLLAEPPDKLRECFETFREQLEKVAEGDEDSARVLKECQALTPTLHTEDVPAEGEIVSA